MRAAWSGIRPLIKDPAKLAAGSTTAQLSRKVRSAFLEPEPAADRVKASRSLPIAFRELAGSMCLLLELTARWPG